MTEHEFHLLLLSPMAISLAVAKMRPGSARADLLAWNTFYVRACQSLDPLPPEPPAPLLRWTCKPPDYDPSWTVDELYCSTWIKIGVNHYHHVTGRCRTGHATFHGRLWNPPEQDEAWQRWKDESRRSQDERDRALSSTMIMHRTAVADHLERYASTYKHRRGGDIIRAYLSPFAERLMADMAESPLRDRFLERNAWLNLTAYRAGHEFSMSDAFMREFTRV